MRMKFAIAAACLGLLSSPAFSQSTERDTRSDRMSHDDRGSSDRYDRNGSDRERASRDDREDDRTTARHHDDSHSPSYGSFMIQNGNLHVAIRCGEESMRTCVDAALTLMDKAKTTGTASTAAGVPEKPRD